ncbi:hypothetical protein J7I42_34775 [Niastella sp. MAH-29]|uniref:G8 domain-containing protein n=2 Tax=Chitinophagaceae TaxID=563835 RepID=A0ABS3Z5R8_9BACT|nr:hypothetical protein [Niastella soli]
MQQGRVQLDADWNEQAEIETYRRETGTADIIGNSGAPMHNAGFKVEPFVASPFIGSPPEGAGNFYITAGHYYVDGILCENEHPILFTEQIDLPATLPVHATGTYLAYLDVWAREITSLEDPQIREVALGGPDTTTRKKTIWQVKLLRLGNNTLVTNCMQDLPVWNTAIASGTGKLSAQAEENVPSQNPCNFISTGGYTGLENQLYRVEIHRAGDRNNATCKWSRDNGSVITKWEDQDVNDKNNLIVSNIGPDEILGFAGGQWIELTDDTHELLGKPGILVRLIKAEGQVLTIDASTIKDPDNPTATSVDIHNFPANPKIRRWDSAGELSLNSAAWINLEDGVQVQFSAGTYKTGDFWNIPARTFIGDIDWPIDQSTNTRIFQLPQGIQHHYCKLAILKFDGIHFTVESDCRKIFPPITELTSLFYVSGDGQEAMPGFKLPNPLKVGVTNGQWPVKGATIEFKIETGGGSLWPSPDETGATASLVKLVTTNEDGIAACTWALGSSGAQRVTATLHNASNAPVHLPVIFTANLSLASKILYDDTSCQNWGNEPHGTVAEAITSLCKRSNTTRRGCSVTVGRGGQFELLEEAFKNVQEEDICICLLPGEHPTDGIRAQRKTIKITGCGATIVLKSEFRLDAEKITLGNIGFQAAAKNAHIILMANEVDGNNCTFIRANDDNEKTPFVLILSTKEKGTDTHLYWNANTITARIALALTNGVNGSIINNTINGAVILQYTPDYVWATEEEREIIKMLTENKLTHTGSLHIHGNSIDNVLTNAFGILKSAEKLSYKSLIVSENVFKGVNNSFVAHVLTGVNNHFIEPVIKNTIAFLGIQVTLMGNVAVNDNTVIQTSFGKPMGVNPNFNLVNIQVL